MRFFGARLPQWDSQTHSLIRALIWLCRVTLTDPSSTQRPQRFESASMCGAWRYQRMESARKQEVLNHLVTAATHLNTFIKCVNHCAANGNANVTHVAVRWLRCQGQKQH